MGIVTAFLTAFYMFRLWFMTFTGEPRDHHAYDHAHEAPKVMWVPLVDPGGLGVRLRPGRPVPGVPDLIQPTMFHVESRDLMDECWSRSSPSGRPMSP